MPRLTACLWLFATTLILFGAGLHLLVHRCPQKRHHIRPYRKVHRPLWFLARRLLYPLLLRAKLVFLIKKEPGTQFFISSIHTSSWKASHPIPVRM